MWSLPPPDQEPTFLFYKTGKFVLYAGAFLLNEQVHKKSEFPIRKPTLTMKKQMTEIIQGS